MRLLPCFAAVALAATTFTTQIASACGGYTAFKMPPSFMLVTSHFMAAHRDDVADRSRAFVIFERRSDVADTRGWQPIAPRTYDYTTITDSGEAKPLKLTLVGPSGTRVVTTGKRRVLIANALYNHDVHEAAEVPVGDRDRFEIAIRGDVPDAKWHDVAYTYTDTHRISGTGITVTRVRGAHESKFELRDDNKLVGVYPGHPVGAVDVNGSRYVIARDGDLVRTIDVGISTLERLGLSLTATRS